jgi:hypothetical protein
MGPTPRLIRASAVVRRFLAKEGVGHFELPPDHLFGMGVPEGGSNCAKCKFVSQDQKHCSNQYFRAWRESLKAEDDSALPEPASRYCCDVFTESKG